MNATLEMAGWLRHWGRALVRRAEELETEHRIGQQSCRRRGQAAWQRVVELRRQGWTWFQISREVGEPVRTCKAMFVSGGGEGQES